MGDGFDQLGFGVAVLLGQIEVEDELVGVAHGGEGGHRDQASFLRVQLVAEPDLAEENVVGEADQGGREVTE